MKAIRHLSIILLSIILLACNSNKKKELPKQEPKTNQVQYRLSSANDMLYLGIYNNEEQLSKEEVGKKLNNSIQDLMRYYKEHDYSFAPISGSYILNLESRGEYVSFLPFSEKINVQKNEYDIKLGKTFEGESLKGTHIGHYNTIEETYKKMLEYIENKGWVSLGYATEMYLTDPAAEPDPSKWETEITIAVESKSNGHIEVTSMPELEYASLRKSITASQGEIIDKQVAQSMYMFNTQIMAACDDSSIQPPFSRGFNIIYNRSDTNVDFEFCVPVPNKLYTNKNVNYNKLTNVKAVKAVHHGAYDFTDTYKKIQDFASKNNIKLDTKSYEFYMNDPRKQKNPSKNITHIFVPIL